MLGRAIGRSKLQIRLKALISSAFSTTSDLDDLAGMVANGVIAGERSAPISDLSVPLARAVPGWPGW